MKQHLLVVALSSRRTAKLPPQGTSEKTEDQPHAKQMLYLACKGLYRAHQCGDLSTLGKDFCRIASMLERVLISSRCSWRHSAVHAATAIWHRR